MPRQALILPGDAPCDAVSIKRPEELAKMVRATGAVAESEVQPVAVALMDAG